MQSSVYRHIKVMVEVKPVFKYLMYQQTTLVRPAFFISFIGFIGFICLPKQTA